MSNVYTLEPQTNAKVILHTTAGDVEIELWGKETPLAARNFLQLCMEGYYDNTIFHRIVPHFIIQGGDPTGTGHGGESIYDESFPDEFHSRLRFIRRGLVGMANNGENDNGSQFFITLDRTDELTKKHTLFGRIGGDTIFNVMTMAEMEVDENERPLYPPRIKSTEIVLNPFDDIIPRISEREKMVAKAIEMQKAEHLNAAKRRKKEKKQLNLLSFGEEAAEFEPPAELAPSKMKSSHDFLPEVEENTIEETPKENIEKAAENTEKNVEEKIKDRPEKEESKKSKRKHVDKKTLQKQPETESYRLAHNATEEVFTGFSQSQSAEFVKPAVASVTPSSRQAQIEALKQDIRRMDRNDFGEEDAKKKKKEKKKSLLELEREKYLSRGAALKGGLKARKANKSEDDTFKKLMAFQKRLSNVDVSKGEQEEGEKEEPPCKLHSVPGCESCKSITVEEQPETDEGWMSHQLVFGKDYKGKDLMQRKETVDDYVVIDPRERGAKAKEEEYLRKKSQKSNVGEVFRKRERDDHSIREYRGSRDDRSSRDDYRRRDDRNDRNDRNDRRSDYDSRKRSRDDRR
ncbi:peptidyl-prolyl isomerase cwc27 [Phycomyces blakesleeanus]|uniref:Peptidyl-prolyl isomerase cwc27 n=1 Tax=Phycomyces blakesleeanus TaxID=4837 RepID=A0ABR3AJW5_PHYBL